MLVERHRQWSLAGGRIQLRATIGSEPGMLEVSDVVTGQSVTIPLTEIETLMNAIFALDCLIAEFTPDDQPV